MSEKNKNSEKSSKRRLALPPALSKNIAEFRSNIKTAKNRGVEEVEKIYQKVADTELVKQLKNHEVYKRATKVTHQLQKDVDDRFKKISQRVETQVKDLREYIPVPSKSEVDELARKVSALNKKVNDLTNNRRPSAS